MISETVSTSSCKTGRAAMPVIGGDENEAARRRAVLTARLATGEGLSYQYLSKVDTVVTYMYFLNG